jgi:hypothetical protein
MTGVVPVLPRVKFTDATGTPIVGGELTVYLAGTTTAATTYQDRTLLTENTNPISLDANGECLLWVDSAYSYKFLLRDAAGATVSGYPVDNIPGAADAVAAAAIAAATVQPYLDAAEAARDGAETAEANAEAARDSLIAAAGVFASTVAGLAGTASGGYFWVPSAVAGESYILYLDNAGVAVEQFRMPSAAAFTTLRATVVPNADYAIQDGSDNAAMLVEDGAFSFPSVDADTINGFARSEITRAVRRSQPNLTASYVGHISYGQSLGQGANAAIHTRTDVGDGFFDCVRFNANGGLTAGPRAQDGGGTVAQNHASFVAYVEQADGSGFGETPLGNAFRMVKTLLRDEDSVATSDYDYLLVGSAPGQANLAIASLIQGSAPYIRLLDDVTYGKSLANAAGKSYACDVVYWSQGEANITAGTARATYSAALLDLYTDLNTDIKALTGQTHDIKLIGYQVSLWNQANPNIALAQLDAAEANSNIILATTVYAVEHIAANDAHLSGFGSATLGAYYGYAAKRVVVDGETWQNMVPANLRRQGSILEFDMPDTGYPWAISDALFPTQTNAGFTALRADGVTDNPITSVTVVGPRRVRIVLTNAENGTLRYGFASWGGNLHDTCDVDPLTARAGVLYQPCLTFEETFA